jgi:hypothetical protein
MQFLIDLSNTALEFKKADLQFFSDILVSVHLPPCTVFCRCGSRRALIFTRSALGVPRHVPKWSHPPYLGSAVVTLSARMTSSREIIPTNCRAGAITGKLRS